MSRSPPDRVAPRWPNSLAYQIAREANEYVTRAPPHTSLSLIVIDVAIRILGEKLGPDRVALLSSLRQRLAESPRDPFTLNEIIQHFDVPNSGLPEDEFIACFGTEGKYMHRQELEEEKPIVYDLSVGATTILITMSSTPILPPTASINTLFKQPPFLSFDDDSSSSNELRSLTLMIRLFAQRTRPVPQPSSCASEPIGHVNPSSNLLSPHSLLLSGPSGIGKRAFISLVTRTFTLSCEHISFGRLITQKNVDGQAAALRVILENVRRKAYDDGQPCVLVFHELELMFASMNAQDEDAQEVMNEFLQFMQAVNQQQTRTTTTVASNDIHSKFLVIGLTNSRSLLSDRILKSFQYAFKMFPPSNLGRRRILQAHLGCSIESAMPLPSTPPSSSPFECATVDWDWLIEQTQGYVGGDLVGLIKAAVGHAVQQRRKTPPSGRNPAASSSSQLPLTLTSDDFRVALERVHPASLKALNVMIKPKPMTSASHSTNIETESSSAHQAISPPLSTIPSPSSFSGVGGLDSVKSQLRELLLWPFLYGHRYHSLGIRPTKGILLYGVPGVGKTLLARTVAQEFQASFLVLHLSDLLHSGVGQSERRIAELFTRAKQVAPAIIFLDEVQAIFGGGGTGEGGGSEVQAKMMAQLLYQMDALQPSTNAPVIVLGATNLPSSLDPALLRAGRLDQVLYVGPPDAAARRAIIEMSRGSAQWAPDVYERMSQIIERTEGYSGVDMVQLVGRAGLCALERSPAPIDAVRFCDFDLALSGLTSSITPQMILTCQRWGERFQQRTTKRKQQMEQEKSVTAMVQSITSSAGSDTR